MRTCVCYNYILKKHPSLWYKSFAFLTGYLPGMNAGAFNLGAGLSFAVLYAAMDAYAAQAGAAGGYAAAMVMGAILLALALATSFLIPKAEDADNS